MTTYYKATRLDGTDFRTGTVLYEVGQTAVPRPLPKNVAKRAICGAGYLHAADVPAMTLVGGSWPCRLFEVTGEPVVGFNAEHPHKGAFLKLAVIREIEAHRALGPNGEAVVALIERARLLSSDEVNALAAARAAAWYARAAAWDAWDAAWAAAWDARAGARAAAWDAARDAARAAAGDAARAAAWALAVRDLITAEQFNSLYGPWAMVIDQEAHLS